MTSNQHATSICLECGLGGGAHKLSCSRAARATSCEHDWCIVLRNTREAWAFHTLCRCVKCGTFEARSEEKALQLAEASASETSRDLGPQPDGYSQSYAERLEQFAEWAAGAKCDDEYAPAMVKHIAENARSALNGTRDSNG